MKNFYLNRETLSPLFRILGLLFLWYGAGWFLFPSLVKRILSETGQDAMVTPPSFFYAIGTAIVFLGIFMLLYAIGKNEKDVDFTDASFKYENKMPENVMVCPGCGALIASNSRYCPRCSYEIPIRDTNKIEDRSNPDERNLLP